MDDVKFAEDYSLTVDLAEDLYTHVAEMFAQGATTADVAQVVSTNLATQVDPVGVYAMLTILITEAGMRKFLDSQNAEDING